MYNFVGYRPGPEPATHSFFASSPSCRRILCTLFYICIPCTVWSAYTYPTYKSYELRHISTLLMYTVNPNVVCSVHMMTGVHLWVLKGHLVHSVQSPFLSTTGGGRGPPSGGSAVVRNENEKNESDSYSATEFRCFWRGPNGMAQYVHVGIIHLSAHTATLVLSGLVSFLCWAGSCSHRSVFALFLEVLFLFLFCSRWAWGAQLRLVRSIASVAWTLVSRNLTIQWSPVVNSFKFKR